LGLAATPCGAKWGVECGTGVAWNGSGCGTAALEKAKVSNLALPAARCLALEKGAVLSFFFEKQNDERGWIRRSAGG